MSRSNMIVKSLLAFIVTGVSCGRIKTVDSISTSNLTTKQSDSIFEVSVQQNIDTLDKFEITGNESMLALENKQKILNDIVKFSVYSENRAEHRDSTILPQVKYLRYMVNGNGCRLQNNIWNNYATALSENCTREIGYDIYGFCTYEYGATRTDCFKDEYLVLQCDCFSDTNICSRIYKEKRQQLKILGFSKIAFQSRTCYQRGSRHHYTYNIHFAEFDIN